MRSDPAHSQHLINAFDNMNVQPQWFIDTGAGEYLHQVVCTTTEVELPCSCHG